MKVEWLNEERTEALVTKGLLWWKRVAVLRQIGFSTWRFVPSGDEADRSFSESLSMEAIHHKVRAELKEVSRRNWQPIGKVPVARALERAK